MKVLLINPPMQVGDVPKFPSFGIAYIAQELKRCGYVVEILDIDAYRYSKTEVIQFIEKNDADFIGIGGLVTVYPYLHWLIPQLKRLRPATQIILGGPVASSLREKCFKEFAIDYEVIGEGEVTLIELLKELSANRIPRKVRGIGFRENGKIVFTEMRPLMSSLDGVPIFDDTLFPMEALLKNAEGAIQIHAQRGCPSNCTFCFNSFRVVGKDVRYRPVNNVLNEIEYLKHKYGHKLVLFAISGECIASNKEWLVNFCQEIINRKLDIKYRITSRVDTIDIERLTWLKKSGCIMMSFGLESGSAKMLKVMGKGTTVEQARRAVALARKYIPTIEASIILGYIGETKKTLRETVTFCKEIGVEPYLFCALPLPGTALYKMALKGNFIKNEDEYLMNLDQQVILKFSVNLTDMRDDKEAKKEIEAAINAIKKHYAWKKTMRLSTYSNIILRLKNRGLSKTLNELAPNLRKLFLPPNKRLN
ncbi:MAG TPA: hypothetical protein DCY56_05985 [Candidatus Omnitrophica bacterium]|nr:hypothetical protein [Candidatus Omnitrophota bacterium]